MKKLDKGDNSSHLLWLLVEFRSCVIIALSRLEIRSANSYGQFVSQWNISPRKTFAFTSLLPFLSVWPSVASWVWPKPREVSVADRERLKITPRVCQTSSSDWNPWKKSKTWRLLKNRVWIIAPENASGKIQLRSCSSNPRIPQKKQTSKQKTKKKPLIRNKYRIKLLPKRLEGRRQNLNSNAHFLRL